MGIKTKCFLLAALALVACAASGCVSSYKHVLLAVVDDTTGAPVARASVSTVYASLSKFSFASMRKSEAITDANGHAVVLGNFLLTEPAIGRTFPKQGFEPAFEVKIDNAHYQIDQVQFRLDSSPPPFDRPKDYIPAQPDLTFRIPNRATEAARQAEHDRQSEREEEQAREWLAQRPDFWPKGEPRENGEVVLRPETLLIDLRWERGAKERLASKEDEVEVERIVLNHMALPKARLGEKRWLSPTLVMVEASWYSGPMAAGGFIYVVEKQGDRWRILAYYQTWIS